MKNFRNNRRRFRNNSFDRNLKINSKDQNINSTIGNISDFRTKKFSRNNFNSSKLIQKYSELAREALSVGDKILYENYLQHAEHFIRISENYSTNKENLSENFKEFDLKKINQENLEPENNSVIENENMILIAKKEIEQIWKELNLININTPSYLDVSLEIKKPNDLNVFKNVLEKIDIIENNSILLTTNKYALIRIKYMGKFTKLRDKFINENLNFEDENGQWKVAIK